MDAMSNGWEVWNLIFLVLAILISLMLKKFCSVLVVQILIPIVIIDAICKFFQYSKLLESANVWCPFENFIIWLRNQIRWQIRWGRKVYSLWSLEYFSSGEISESTIYNGKLRVRSQNWNYETWKWRMGIWTRLSVSFRVSLFFNFSFIFKY